MKDILHEICKYNAKGANKNTWELKEEYKQSNSYTDSKKTPSSSSGDKKKDDTKEDFMDDDDEDLDDSDISEDDDMVETM